MSAWLAMIAAMIESPVRAACAIPGGARAKNGFPAAEGWASM